MHINGSSPVVQSVVPLDMSEDRAAIPPIAPAQGRIDLKGCCIPGLLESIADGVILYNCAVHNDLYFPLETLIKTNAGAIKTTLCEVYGGVFSNQGMISIYQSVVHGDVRTAKGEIKILRQSICRDVFNKKYNTTISQSTVSSITSLAGHVKLTDATVTGNASLGKAALTMTQSAIHGKLEINNNILKIGEKCEINNLKINRVDENPPVEETIQIVTLYRHSTLNQLEFNGDKCYLILLDGAEYYGARPENLEVRIQESGLYT